MTSGNKIRYSLLILPSLLVGFLWLVSGRETLTKHIRNVQAEVKDSLFGDTITQTLAVPGPVLGYYIGLDLVGLVAIASLLIAAGFYLFGHRLLRSYTDKSNYRVQ